MTRLYIIIENVMPSDKKDKSADRKGLKTDNDLQLKKWREELASFKKIAPELSDNSDYTNKYIAIKDKKIIDFDPDNFRLVKRINKKYPEEVVLVVKVSAVERICEVPSPEISR